MWVTCRPCDTQVFVDLGFDVREENGTSCNLYQQEANYALSGQMPTNIPYVGWHGEGSEYEGHEMVCDGNKLFEVPVSKGGDLFVYWDEATNAPDKRWVGVLKDFIRTRNIIRKMFDEDPLIAQMAQAKYLAAHPGSDESTKTAGETKQ